jgi:hypothetical protein
VSPVRIPFRHIGLFVPFLLSVVGMAQIGNGSGVGTAITSTGVPSSVAGRVVNATTGQPIPRALVRLNSRAVLTDSEGKFRFEQNTESSANLLVAKPGFYASAEYNEPGNLYLQAAQMAALIELRLYPEALLTGVVTAPDGTSLPGISVSATRSVYDDSGHRWMTAGQTQTDSHGSFRLPVSAGEYRLQTLYSPQNQMVNEAVLPQIVPIESSGNGSQVIKIHAGEEQHFELRPGVSPVHTVTITQTSSDRRFMTITAYTSNGGALLVNPQANGGETKIQLPRGTYTLLARTMVGSGQLPEQAETTVTVPDHDISGVVLQFSPVPSIPVEMLIDGSSTSDNTQPTLSQLGLSLQSEQADSERGGRSNLSSTGRPDKSFAFQVVPGSYRLTAHSSGAWYVKSATYGDSDLLQQELVVAPGASSSPIRIMVSNQTGGLQGTVKLGGEPGACWVYLIPSGPSAQIVYSARSSASGSYSFASLPPGSYQAIAFERRHSADYRNPESLAAFNDAMHSVSINAGDKPTLNLDAVPVAEVIP